MSGFGRIPALALAVVAAACASSAASDVAREPANQGEVVLEAASPKFAFIAVDSVRVTRERVVAVLPAQVALDEDHTVRVFSPVTGRIRELLVRPGDLVKKGAPLALIASGDFAQATSDRVKADAADVQSAAALRRAEDLYAHRVISQKDLEQARSDAAQAHAEADRARQRAAQLGGGEGVQGDYVLRAPIDGTVIDRGTNAGAEVRPDATTPLITLSSLDTLWLVAQAPQRDLAWLHRGARLAFTTDAIPGRVFDARVRYVSDQLDPLARTALVRATLSGADRSLRAMVVGSVRLYASTGTEQAVVPTRALVTRGGETVVFVEKGRGHFLRRVVQVGDDDGVTATIVAGLAKGEWVVTRGSVLLAAEAERLP
jgi:cobalt-zinc-cadmium efflux system membrane fusion protein